MSRRSSVGAGEAVTPMSPTIRRLGPGDASVLDEVAPDVFDNAIDPRGTAEFLADPRHHLAVAESEPSDGGSPGSSP